MLRWLKRLVILGLIALAVVFIAGRLMRQEEDFDDYDDIESGFEFQETPVEIDVPAESSAPSDGHAEASPSKLTDITGIGPAYEARLQAAGINTVEDLAGADAGSLAEQVEVIGGVSTIEDWISQAQGFSSGGSNGHRS
jgi:predicted flap endonuclease-1-like 5' DNA nuclease